MTKTMTVAQFLTLFPDDAACLAHLMKLKYGEKTPCPKCGKESKFHAISKTPAFSCQWCGHHIHPMTGTPFEATHTPLQKWFYAMYLFTTSRHGVAAKELQRQLGVTYKTAWRMAHEIRKYMGKVDGDPQLKGHVEVDETFIGGYMKGGHAGKGKAIVFGALERDGKVMTQVIPDRKEKTLHPIIQANIAKGSQISSDDWHGYGYLGPKGYKHQTVNHSAKEYVRGNVHTNSIEGFWSRVKNSIKGTHIHVSKKHLSKYMVEFEFRYNMRKNPWAMFDLLLMSFT